ncbi:gluconate 2-dehydrogenase subunit 3 family protein [Halomarina ordinaria]|uniref:Gluconate 2-dehydrogenase subunit 3 family protein n=1 Tax=Halomarina ordinaria TaxID=3033939 RepID=A0ABD5U926_9EURY|nr:gluconate 2-dehydrogenase subunit 3 family protein [Halomarina sp. PSRA2]
MKLTRRDALVALASLGVAGGGVAHLAREGDRAAADEGGVEALGTLVAAAEVLYPSDVEGIESFVESYSLGRVEDREAYREGLDDALSEVEAAARSWYDDSFAALDRETRDALLRELGADVADAVPDGSRAERVRYYVVDELLYAFYASPTGAELAGNENPVGHPGGTEAYQA